MEDAGAGGNVAASVLKVFANDICRREILDYVPIKDLVRSERVCKAWQNALNDYLENRCMLTLDISTTPRSRFFGSNHRTIRSPHDCPPPVFSKMIEKLGPSLVGLSSDRYDKQFFEKLASKYPHMRHLKLKYLSVGPGFIIEPELEAEIWNIKRVEADCKNMTCLKLKKIKSLSLVNCKQPLNFAHSLVASYLPNITNLELDGIPIDTLIKVNLLLDKMQGLESVSLRCYNLVRGQNKISKEFTECFGRLGHLRRLKIIMNVSSYDALLEALARGCKRLEHLHIAGSGLTGFGRGLGAMILRAPAAVTTVSFVQDVAPKKIKELLKELEAYGCRAAIETSVRWKGQTSLKFKQQPPTVGAAKIPELKITIDSLRLSELEYEVIQEM